jgi:hypothetical protein
VASRVLTGLVGLAVWAYGLSLFVEGDHGVGGAIVLAGGFLLVVALQGGWGQLLDAITTWLHFR